MTLMKVLVVEDDASLARVLERGLAEEGHEVTRVGDGERALVGLCDGDFDLCVLDVMLPRLDGFAVVEQARAAGVTTPILLLTARDAVPDRVEGLRRGADDYLSKPFAFAELLARLEALSRRGAPRPSEPVVRAGDLTLDRTSHKVTLAGRALALSEKQFALLDFLLRHRGQVVTRRMVLQQVFGYAFDPGTNLVDVHVGHLRQKIDVAGKPSRITTVRGVGYRLELA
jgi:two-component system OmpR family response regulator